MSNEPTITINNPYVICPRCQGSGHQDGMNGIETCYECKGDCVVRDRDERGRFITHPETLYHQGDGLYGTEPPETLLNGTSPRPHISPDVSQPNSKQGDK